MGKVKRLWVTVSYEVDLGDLEIPDDVLEELNEAFEHGNYVSMNYSPNAFEWLVSNVNQDDSYRDEYEIQQLEYEEN